MKPFFISLTLSASIVALLLFFSHAKFDVKYEQYFGDKTIVLTEELTLSERLALKHKKGFKCWR